MSNLSLTYLLINIHFGINDPEFAFGFRKTNGLLSAQAKEAAGAKTIVKKLEYLLLQGRLEINKHVAATDQLKFIEDIITDEVMYRK